MNRSKLLLAILLSLFFIASFNAVSGYSSNQPADALDWARIDAFLRIASRVKTDVWPGWEPDRTPILLYGPGEGEFLINHPAPPDGFKQVIPSPLPQHQVFYNPKNQSSGITATILSVAGIGAITIPKKSAYEQAVTDSMKRHLGKQDFDRRFPSGSYHEATRVYISMMAHEAFHTLQLSRRDERAAGWPPMQKYYNLSAENNALRRIESGLLYRAVTAQTEAERLARAAEFLNLRHYRRQRLSNGFVDLERWQEWVEGGATYVESRFASEASRLELRNVLGQDRDFSGFVNTKDSDPRLELLRSSDVQHCGNFYWTGLAIAYLLDRVEPSWKQNYFAPTRYLDDLLSEALAKSCQAQVIDSRSLLAAHQYEKVLAGERANLGKRRFEVDRLVGQLIEHRDPNRR